MTQDKNQGSENLNWMEIADTDAINEPRHTGQRLPFIAAAVSLLIIGGGAVFAQTSNEAPAQAEETSVTQTSQTSQTPVTMSDPATTASSPSIATPSTGAPVMTPGGIPVIPNVAPGVNGSYDDDDDEDDEDDEEDEDEDDDDDEDEDDD
jgi:hypothetical protein